MLKKFITFVLAGALILAVVPAAVTAGDDPEVIIAIALPYDPDDPPEDTCPACGWISCVCEKDPDKPPLDPPYNPPPLDPPYPTHIDPDTIEDIINTFDDINTLADGIKTLIDILNEIFNDNDDFPQYPVYDFVINTMALGLTSIINAHRNLTDPELMKKNRGMLIDFAAMLSTGGASAGIRLAAPGIFNQLRKFSVQTIRCPVNVKILDKDENLLAVIRNGEPDIIITGDVVAFADGDAKYIGMPADKISEYKFEFEATGDGVMTFTNMYINPDGSIWDLSAFIDVPLSEGGIFDVILNDGNAAQLYGGNGNEIEPHILINDEALTEALLSEGLSEWAVPAVLSAIKRGLATQELLNDFKANTTREEFCRAAVNFIERYYGKFVADILEERGLEAKMFADTDDPAISAAAALGITSGTDAARNLFSPGLPLTREQAATMLKRTLGITGTEVSGTAVAWIDAGDISDWAAEAIDIIYAAGVMGGTSTDSLVFSPELPYTREQSIVTFDRLWDYFNN